MGSRGGRGCVGGVCTDCCMQCHPPKRRGVELNGISAIGTAWASPVTASWHADIYCWLFIIMDLIYFKNLFLYTFLWARSYPLEWSAALLECALHVMVGGGQLESEWEASKNFFTYLPVSHLITYWFPWTPANYFADVKSEVEHGVGAEIGIGSGTYFCHSLHPSPCSPGLPFPCPKLAHM